MTTFWDRMDDSSWRRWVSDWAAEVNAAAATMTATFEARYGFCPGVNAVRMSGDADRVAAARYRGDMLHDRAMAVFYEVIAEVSLPDVGIGYFIQSAEAVIRMQEEIGYVLLLHADDPHGMVIGSDGSGLVYVMDWGGVIHRSLTATTDGGFVRVADDIEHFLDRLRHVVVTFATAGEVVPL